MKVGKYETCPDCGDTGYRNGLPCERCHGCGVLMAENTVVLADRLTEHRRAITALEQRVRRLEECNERGTGQKQEVDDVRVTQLHRRT